VQDQEEAANALKQLVSAFYMNLVNGTQWNTKHARHRTFSCLVAYAQCPQNL